MAELSSRALASVDDVKVYANIDVADQGYDDLIIRLVNSASGSIHKLAGREFKPVGANPQTRTFDVPYSVFDTVTREIRVGDLAAYTTVTVNGTAIAGTNVVALPRVREEWEPIRRLRITGPTLYWWQTNASWPSTTPATVAVAGNFGFPLVPEDIRQACIVTVAVWLERDIRHFSETFSLEEGRVELPRTLPRQAYDTVILYQDPKL